jgi:shikimate dehydrogenase
MKKLAVIGDPIDHSLGPSMWNGAFKALGLERDFVYESLRVKSEDLGSFVKKIREGAYLGANVTIPHKIDIVRYLDGLTEKAKSIGAVNTIYIDGGLKGENTDGEGALRALEEKIDIEGKKILILGAGGSARAVAFTLAPRVKEITILNRTRAKAEEIAKEIRKTKTRAGGLPVEVDDTDDADVVINCTPIGMKGAQEGKSLVKRDLLRPDQLVMDVVYNPLETALLKEAKAIGAVTISGYEMLVYQAVENFRRWTGREAPVDLMMGKVRGLLEHG